TLTVSNSTLTLNSTGSTGSGGGIYNEGSLTVLNSTITSNFAGDYFGAGGGISSQSYYYSSYGGDKLTVINSTLSNNSAGIGRRIYFSSASAYFSAVPSLLTNVTIAANHVTNISNIGGLGLK